METRTAITCPACGGRVVDEGTWICDGKFYCSETCCRKAARSE